MQSPKIINKVVNGGPATAVPGHLNFGQYMIDKLKENCQEDNVAMISGETGHQMRFKQILQDVVDVASGLRKLGVKRGDIIAFCSENRDEYIATAIATVCCGATITTANLQYTKDEMAHVLNISRPKIIIASEDALKLNLKSFKSISSVKTIIQFNGKPIERKVIPWSSILVQTNVDDFEVEDVEGWSDIVFILYSSGTTGLPKGVMISHLNALYGAVQFIPKPEDPNLRMLTLVPWYHAYGLMSTIYYLAVGRCLVYFAGFQPLKYLQAIQDYKVNLLLAVPPIVVFLAKHPMVEKFDLSSVNVVLCGAAPLSADTIHAAMQRLPNCIGIFQAYGMTETSLSATKDIVSPDAKSKPGSGGIPLPGVKLKVVDLETGRKLGPNEQGEVCIKGPIIMRGYAGNKAATQAMIDKEGYLKTGDIGYYDEDGYIFIVDRLKELIKYKGSQVNLLLAVPPIVVFLAKHPMVEKFDLSSVNVVLCGAAPLSADTIHAAMQRLPNCIGIFQAYGMTETSLSATKDIVSPDAKSKPGSGGIPLPGVKLKVVDLETGRKLGPNEQGEVCIKGPIIMRGYAGNKAATQAMIDKEGYLKTGDIGYYDEDGYIFIVDRLKELIKYKGSQVPPAEVESVLLQHAAVAECGVVGAPDERAGELATAFVVLKPGATATEQELLEFSATRLSREKHLYGGIIFVKEIPKNPSGKILRRVLKEQLRNKKKSKL